MRIGRRFFGRCLMCLTMLVAPAYAEDIDLFMNPPVDAGGALPNVLIILDNTANWSRADDGTTKFAFEKAALTQVLTQLNEDGGGFNVGLMMFSERGGGNSNPSGGYVRYALKNDLEGLIEEVAALDENDDKGSEAEFAIAFHEAYLYFEGLDARAGDKVKTDLEAFIGEAPPTYRSPVVDVCVSNYIIFISNGPPSQGENTTASNLLDALGGKLPSDPITLSPSGRQANWSDEYVRFLAANGVNSYAIDVRPETTGQGPSNTALMKSIANQGNGAYYAVDNALELQIALENVFSEIQAINSVFAASALPVSVNVRGTYQNEVYMGVFRPDENASPRWFGNLKLFQFVVDSQTNSLVLADKYGEPIQSPVTGFIRPTAESFWTDASDYWAFSPRGTPPTVSDAPDGEVVEKGGTAQRQRVAFAEAADLANRKLYTCTGACSSGSALSGTPFDTGNAAVSAAALGVDAADREPLINWVRGLDNTDPPERAAGEVRPSIHGDVIHSRPAVVNYNRSGNDTDVIVFYGANDGVFRAVRGGKTTAGGGNELWGMVFPEHFGQLKRLRDNDVPINFPADPVDTSLNKPYFADGNVSIYTSDVNGDGRLRADEGDKVYLYATMRRGGRFIYALDVSDPDTPKFLWKKGCFGAGPTCDSGYAELGQTWATAQVGRVRINVGDTAATKPVLFIAAGYDQAAEDVSPQGTASMGRGMMIVDAETGDVLWQVGPNPSGAETNVTRADMIHSFPAEITLVDSNRNGLIEKLYGVDTGGNVWSVDLGSASPGSWSVSKVASLGGSGADARKFLSRAEVVSGSDSRGDYTAVLVGSGDREKPFGPTDGTDVTNAFFMVKDRGAGETITIDDLYDATANLIQDGTEEQRAVAAEELDAAEGWYITLRPGEQVVGEAVAVSGTVFFPTNQPGQVAVDACVGNLGIARIYSIDYRDGRATVDRDGLLGLTVTDRSGIVPGGGFLPSPTHVVIDIDGVPYEGVTFGATTEDAGEGLGGRKRRYWSTTID